MIILTVLGVIFLYGALLGKYNTLDFKSYRDEYIDQHFNFYSSCFFNTEI